VAIEGVDAAAAVAAAVFPHAAAEWAAEAVDSLPAAAVAGAVDPAAEAAAAAWAAAKKSSSNPIATRACLFLAAKRTPCSPGSVADPDPHVFGPPGSGSTSTRYGSGSGSGSSCKNRKKNLDYY
jgi:hypothetical protein